MTEPMTTAKAIGSITRMFSSSFTKKTVLRWKNKRERRESMRICYIENAPDIEFLSRLGKEPSQRELSEELKIPRATIEEWLQTGRSSSNELPLWRNNFIGYNV